MSVREVLDFLEPLKRRLGTASGAAFVASDPGLPLWATIVIAALGVMGDLIAAHYSTPRGSN